MIHELTEANTKCFREPQLTLHKCVSFFRDDFKLAIILEITDFRLFCTIRHTEVLVRGSGCGFARLQIGEAEDKFFRYTKAQFLKQKLFGKYNSELMDM